MNCDDLLLGGTLSGTGISGGTSINNTALSVADWSTLFGTVGMTGTIAAVYGRPGGYVAGDRLPRERVSTLSVNVHKRPADPENCTPSELSLMDNTDNFLALLSDRDGVYLEVVLPDASTRFTHVYNLDPAPMLQPTAFRRFNVPLISEWGNWWAGGNESTDAINGADTLVVGGTQIVYDAVLEFPGDGTFTHSGLGWVIQVVNATGAVHVRLGDRYATNSAGTTILSNRIRRTPVANMSRVWGWFEPGNNAVTSTVAVTVRWRNQYL